MKQIPFFEQKIAPTPILPLQLQDGKNRYFVKRDDLIPFSFGGNKVRKAAEFYKEIKTLQADAIVTYGSNSSNHCRIIANIAASMGLPCYVISPEENREMLYNTRLVEMFGATVETCPVTGVAETIEKRLAVCRMEGKSPYFIAGGGHGNCGTQAYVNAYQEILAYEKKAGIYFDIIFHASGTGTTQAGLICGKLLSGDRKRQIVGISIAREEIRGRQVVKDSIREYLGTKFDSLYREEDLIFSDAYRMGGYGCYDAALSEMIQLTMLQEGIPMDGTYVGKAFYGMQQYIQTQEISGKNILFLHTGGTPLFFDWIKKGTR